MYENCSWGSKVAKVQVFTTTYCPHCVAAKALLRSKGVEFEETDVTGDPELRQRMVELSGGRRTVPQIFIDGAAIGGYEELRALDDEGRLDGLLGAHR